MQNASFQATGEAMPAVNRRTFLRTSANASAAALGGIAVAATPAVASAIGAKVPVAAAAGDAEAERLDVMLAAYLADAREGRRLRKALSDAKATLPAWARPGPAFLRHDGTKDDSAFGWPEVADLPPPPPLTSPPTLTCIRPNPHDAWKEVKRAGKPTYASKWGDDGSFWMSGPQGLSAAERKAARLEALRKMRVITARCRAQRDLHRKAGLPELEAAFEKHADYLGDQRGLLSEAAVGPSLAAIGMKALMEALNDDGFATEILAQIAPGLTGLLRVVVDDYLVNQEEGYYATILGTGDIRGLA